jgi:hypothetical protein
MIGLFFCFDWIVWLNKKPGDITVGLVGRIVEKTTVGN